MIDLRDKFIQHIIKQFYNVVYVNELALIYHLEYVRTAYINSSPVYKYQLEDKHDLSINVMVKMLEKEIVFRKLQL